MKKKIGFWKRLLMLFSEKKAQALVNSTEAKCLEYYNRELDTIRTTLTEFTNRVNNVNENRYVNCNPWSKQEVGRFVLQDWRVLETLAPGEPVKAVDQKYIPEVQLVDVKYECTRPEEASKMMQYMKRVAAEKIGEYLIDNEYVTYMFSKDGVNRNIMVLSVLLNLYNAKLPR